jgi:hypothetical protein
MWLADHATIRINGTTPDDDTGAPVPVIAIAMPRWRAQSLAVALQKWTRIVELVDEGQSLDETELARMLHAAVEAAGATNDPTPTAPEPSPPDPQPSPRRALPVVLQVPSRRGPHRRG